MKKILSMMAILVITGVVNVSAQSGWVENTYYDERGGTDIICGSCYSVFMGYDTWGRPVYQWYQNCQRRVWHSWYGGRNGYYWICNGGNCYWDSRYEVRNWWYFTWTNFTRLCN